MLITSGAAWLGGCVATAYPEPVSYAEITAAPYVYYGGHPVYWHHGYWYYRDGDRWMYYRREPPELYQYRQRPYIQQAPPAPRPITPPGYAAPPAVAPPPAPAPRTAPPAVRVP